MKSSSFHWKAAVFTRKPYKSTNSRQILQFHCVLGGGYVWWFHENHHFSWKALWFSWKAAVLTEKQWFSLGNLINQLIQDKSFSFIVCLGEAMSDDSMKTTAFHENCCFSWKPHKRPPIARNGNPMFYLLHWSFIRKTYTWSKTKTSWICRLWSDSHNLWIIGIICGLFTLILPPIRQWSTNNLQIMLIICRLHTLILPTMHCNNHNLQITPIIHGL